MNRYAVDIVRRNFSQLYIMSVFGDNKLCVAGQRGKLVLLAEKNIWFYCGITIV